MAFEFKFPDVGEGIAEGEIVEWLIKEGDQVKQDQVICKIETDKAVVDIPSPKSGTILKINFKEGETIKVGQVLVLIGNKGEKVKISKKEEIEEEKKKSVSVVGSLEEAVTEIKPIKTKEVKKLEGRALATPKVKYLARKLHVDLTKINGTGKKGEITEEDVRKTAGEERIIPQVPAPKITRKYDLYGYVDRIPLKGTRRIIAEHMIDSISHAAHVTHMDEIDVTELTNIREKEKVKAEKRGIKLTYLPFIVKALIEAFKKHPMVNSSIENEEIIIKKYYNVGIAVDSENGLVVPVIKGADKKSIMNLAKEIFELAEKVRKRTIDLMDLKGGSFTITNVGSIGGLFATPIINYPECAILALGRIYDKVVYLDKKLKVRKMLPVSLSFDHRIIDGAEAARFVNTLKEYLEDPEELFLEIE